MQIDGWKYYNHAAIPTTAPHEDPNVDPINDGSIWKINGRPLLARWTTEFDCGYETNWWYVIKDSPFDINKLKAKRRYEINKGNKNFNIREIDPAEWCEKICEVTIAACSTYPKTYRPNLNYEQLIADIKSWTCYKVYGAFGANDESFCGYACLETYKKHIEFCMMKTLPSYEKLGINAAIVNHILSDHTVFLCKGGYICDGARNIYHETAFQSFLEKYFGFKKAYCHLHVVYNKKIFWLIKLLYPIRSLLLRLDHIRIVHKLNSVLRMEEICRKGR